MTRRLRLLCRVVDNFGDAGVCWRLARQLATEHGWHVRLLIDRPELLERLSPDTPAGTGGPVDVERWPADGPDAADDIASDDIASDDIAGDDILISAFGAEPPAALRRRLAGAPRRPLWVNLEYLSAEDWVDDCHGLSSLKAIDGAREHFYYPGFTLRSGGLLRERGLIEHRDRFVGSIEQQGWLAGLGIDRRRPDERLITLFCYPDAPVAAWLALLAADARPSTVLVPESVADAALRDFAGAPCPPGSVHVRGALRVRRMHFLPQDDYDRLLWSADLNFVRGEDSWIRAHWAGRPFVWQPYRQDDGAHVRKLEAFLSRLDAGPATDRMMRAWGALHGPSRPTGSSSGSLPNSSPNSTGPAARPAEVSLGAAALAQAWHDFDAQQTAIAPRFRAWSQQLAGQADLATKLAAFCAERL